MIKTLNIDLCGQQWTLMFGRIGLYRHIKIATKEDPFIWIRRFDGLVKKAGEGTIAYDDYEDIIILLFAGLNTQLDVKDEENIPLERVQKWSSGLSEKDLANVLQTALIAIIEGEAVAPPKNGAVVKGGELPGTNSELKPTESTV